MKSLTGISQGFDKCTKTTLQNNNFWGTPPNGWFCLEIWSRYNYNKKRRKFQTILIWRSSRKMNRNKNLLILYYLWKKLFKFSNALKKVFHALPFQLCSTANSKFSFYVSLCGINGIKIQIMSLLCKSIYFSRNSFCFIYFDVIIRQRLRKSSSYLELFFQSREWNENMWSCATTDTGHAQRSYLTAARLSVA